MKSILILMRANLSKNRGQSISLLLFILIAVMFLNIGLVMFFDFGDSFEQRAEELNSPHVTILQENGITTKAQEEWLKNYPNVTEIEIQDTVGVLGDYYMNDAKAAAILILSNAEARQSMNPPALIGESLPLDDNSIYVPYLMKVAGGYKLGDSFKIIISGVERKFTIAGFTEEITYGSLMNTVYRFYFSDNVFNKLYKEIEGGQSSLFSIRLNDSSLGMALDLDYTKEFFYSEGTEEASDAFISILDFIVHVKTSRIFLPMIISIIVVVFAAIILLISLIVIRFGINNNIEESMTNIGALKAIGYKNGQIIAATVLQFALISIVSGILGIGLAQAAMSPIARVLESQSAIIWNPGFDPIWALISTLFVLSAVTLTSFLSARRIYKLYPLAALRGGIETHSFRKNRFPLDRSRGSLPLLIGMKHMTQNARQSLMIILIITVMTFASVTGISIYYNLGVQTDEFISIVAGEKPDAALMTDSAETAGILKRLQARDDVRKAFEYQNITLMTDDITSHTVIVKDYEQLEGKLLAEGRYPKYSNEIALGGNLSEVLGKKIGDTVKIRQSDKSGDFLVTGIIQLMNNSGMNMAMTHEALLTIQEDYLFNQIYIYLREGENVGAFLESVSSVEGNAIASTIEIRELVDAQFSQYGVIFAAVAAVILGITALIVILTLYMVIKTMILRKKRELGIQKALGFTTMQLMNQIALHYTPLIFLGVLIGGFCGYIGLNPLFAALTKSVGVIKTELPAPLDWTIITCAALTAVAYIVSLLVSSRIRRVSPCELTGE